MPQRLCRALITMALLADSTWAMRRPGEEIRPGFNLFSKQQDIEIGRQAAAEVRRKYPAVKSVELQNYLRRSPSP
jgi:hypothetical protein